MFLSCIEVPNPITISPSATGWISTNRPILVLSNKQILAVLGFIIIAVSWTLILLPKSSIPFKLP